MTTESVAPESVPAENVLDVPKEVADATPEETPPVADSTPAPEAGETPAKKQDGFSKRIDELTRDYYAERQAREASDREVRELRQRLETVPAKPPTSPTAAPRLEDFAFDEEKFREADREYNRAEAARIARETLREERDRADAQARAEAFATRQREYVAKHPEYQAKVMDRAQLPISAHMQSLILKSDFGPQVAEYLVDHPEYASRVFHLDPLDTARELGRIEAKFDSKPVPPVVTPRVSAAPPPPPKLEAKDAAPAKSIDDPKISDAEFARIRRNQIAQRR